MSATVSVKEAAERLGVTRQAVMALIHRGTLPALREPGGPRGTRYFIPVSAVNERAVGMVVADGWVTIPTAAKARGIDASTLRDWIRLGRVKVSYTPLGRYVSLAEVMATGKRRPGPRGNRPKATADA